MQVVYGRWLIDGYPKVVLFDIASALWKVDDWKQEIWDTSHIGIPWVDQEATDAVAFGFLTAIFLTEVGHISLLLMLVNATAIDTPHARPSLSSIGEISDTPWKIHMQILELAYTCETTVTSPGKDSHMSG